MEIQDSNLQTGFLAQFNPAPVDLENADANSLVVLKQNFAKMVTIEGDKIRYTLQMKVSKKRRIVLLNIED